MPRLLCLLAFAVAVSTPRLASAEPTTPAPSTDPVVLPAQPAPSPVTGEPQGAASYRAEGGRSHWYGWQTLAVDGAAIASLAIPVGTGNTTTLAVSGMTYAFGAPIVHLAHRRPVAAVASFVMRISLAILGSYAGWATESCSQAAGDGLLCGVNGAEVGFLVGAAGSMAVDAAALARENVEQDDSRSNAALSLAPTFGVSRGSGSVGLVGSF